MLSKEYYLSDVSRLLSQVVHHAARAEWDKVTELAEDLKVLARAAKRGEPLPGDDE